MKIQCLDLSDPHILKMSTGCDLMKPLPQLTLGVYPQDLGFAIDGERMAVTYQTSWSEYISVFDISDPRNVKEISRQKLPVTRQMSNWKYNNRYYAGSLVFDDGLLMRLNYDNLHFYQWKNDKYFAPYARILNALPTEGVIQQFWLRENDAGERSILLLGKHNLAQFAIGPNQSLNSKDAEIIDLYNIPGLADTVRSFEDIKDDWLTDGEGGES